jgi:hypothetical protein
MPYFLRRICGCGGLILRILDKLRRKKRSIPFGMDDLFSDHGILKPQHNNRWDKSLYIKYRARAEIALDVCSLWSGGDYFEFGSDGMGTFRSFLSAFHMNDLMSEHPDTTFWAFDLFGEVDEAKIPAGEEGYFRQWSGVDKLKQARDYIDQHGLFVDRCKMVRGFFEDTLNDDIQTSGIGFAFLDCNIVPSYRTCFDFIAPRMLPLSFIYMDEYFSTIGVPEMFDGFCRDIEGRRGMRARYMRSAGAFGALFRLMPIR